MMSKELRPFLLVIANVSRMQRKVGSFHQRPIRETLMESLLEVLFESNYLFILHLLENYDSLQAVPVREEFLELFESGIT